MNYYFKVFYPTSDRHNSNWSYAFQEKLTTGAYVHLIALDLSKAFGSGRHLYLDEQLSEMPTSDQVNNSTEQCLLGSTSAAAMISASIVQKS